MKLLTVFIAAASVGFAANNLTLGSLSLAIDGITITATVGGGTPPYSITDCTGITLSGGPASTATCSVSGATLTYLMASFHPIYKSQTPTLTIAAGASSNLTDSLSNHAQGQSGLAVTNNSTWYGPSLSPFTASSRVDGGGWSNGSNQSGGLVWQSGGAGVRFNATVSSPGTINAVVYMQGTIWQLLQDGAQVGALATVGNGNAFGQTSAATSWTTTAGSHTYTLQQIGVDANGTTTALSRQYSVLSAIQITNGTLTGTQPAAIPFAAACGDSIIDIHQVSYTSQGFIPIAAANLGMFANYFGSSGTGVSTTAGGMVTICPSTAGLGFQGGAPDITILQGSWADAAFNGGVGVPVGTPAGGNTTYAGAVFNDISNSSTYNAGGGSVKKAILFQGLLPSNQGTSGQATTYDAGAAAAMAAYNAGTPAVPGCFYHVYAWITQNVACIPAGGAFGGAHPSVACEAVMGNNLTPILAGYENGSSFSLTGGGATYTGTPVTLTVALPGGATFAPGAATLTGTFAQPVTLSDGGSGGGFLTSVGPAGVSTVTATATGGNSWTATYTPSSKGTKTISASGSADCWIAPSPVTVTARGVLFPMPGVVTR